MAQLAVLVVSSLVLYFGWRLVQNYVVKSPLDKIPGPPSASIISAVATASMFQIFNHNSWQFVDDLVQTYGPLAKLQGFFGTRMLHIYDPKAMHSIYVKDQDNYYWGEKAVGTIRLLLGPGLLGTYGAVHKKQRKMLNPVFLGAHRHNLTPLFYDVVGRLQVALESRVSNGPWDLNILSWMGRTTLELVGCSGLGYSFNPLVAESKDVFTESVKSFIPVANDIVWMQEIIPFLPYLGPVWFCRFLLQLIPFPSIQRLKTITDVMTKRTEEIYYAKKKAIESGDKEVLNALGEGKDVMSVL
ncbi:hypothetical protein V8D89_015009, partial [Ganoderma adspersum]